MGVNLVNNFNKWYQQDGNLYGSSSEMGAIQMYQHPPTGSYLGAAFPQDFYAAAIQMQVDGVMQPEKDRREILSTNFNS